MESTAPYGIAGCLQGSLDTCKARVIAFDLNSIDG